MPHLKIYSHKLHYEYQPTFHILYILNPVKHTKHDLIQNQTYRHSVLSDKIQDCLTKPYYDDYNYITIYTQFITIVIWISILPNHIVLCFMSHSSHTHLLLGENTSGAPRPSLIPHFTQKWLMLWKENVLISTSH